MAERNKSTDGEMAIRVSIVLDMLDSGLRRAEILQNSTILDFNVSDRQIDEYIRQANEIREKQAEKNADKTYKKVQNRLEFLYRKTVSTGDLKTALAVLDKMSELDGLKITKQAQVTKDGEDIDLTNITITFE